MWFQRKRHRRKKLFRPRFEQLERRDTPAVDILTAAAGGATGSFTDSNGDLVTVTVYGTSGMVDFDDDAITGDNDGIVEDTEDIAKITITDASSDLRMAFTSDSAGGADVFLGDITVLGDRNIRGIYTIDTGQLTTFSLKSFVGRGLSANGSINVDTITGNAAGVGLSLTHLGVGRVINVRSGDLDGDVNIARNLGGVINVVSGDWNGDLVVGRDACAEIIVHGAFNGSATIGRDFRGSATIDGDVTGPWEIFRNVSSNAQLNADGDWTDVTVHRHLAGNLTSGDEIASIHIDGDLLGGGRILAEQGITLTVNGSVRRGATVLSTDDTIFAEIDGNVGANALFQSSEDESMTLSVHGGFNGKAITSYDGSATLTMDVDGSVGTRALISSTFLELTVGGSSQGRLFSKDDMTVTVNGNLFGTVISGDDALISVGGNLRGVISTLYELTLTVDGEVLRGTKVTSTDDSVDATVGTVHKGAFFQSSEDEDMTLTVHGGFNGKAITSYDGSATLSVDVDGSVGKSALLSSTYLTLTVGGSSQGRLFSKDDMTVTVDGNLCGTVVSGDDALISVGGNLRGVISTLFDLTLTVDGHVLPGTKVTSTDDSIDATVGKVHKDALFESSEAADLSLHVNGHFNGTAECSPDAGNLTMEVDGGVGRWAVIHAEDAGIEIAGGLAGSIEVANLDLNVGQDVSRIARISVLNDLEDDAGRTDADSAAFEVFGKFLGLLDVAGDIEDAGTIVHDGVGSKARIHINSLNAAVEFGNTVNGRLSIGSDLDEDLTIHGDASRIIIGGEVLSTITIDGNLDFLASNSLFDAGTNEFKDGTGAVTGELAVGGVIGEVDPLF